MGVCVVFTLVSPLGLLLCQLLDAKCVSACLLCVLLLIAVVYVCV